MTAAMDGGGNHVKPVRRGYWKKHGAIAAIWVDEPECQQKTTDHEAPDTA
ncbi:MAG: hypothetical protein GY862_39220 [Gammaproteobacteria bacterium]|nr:hypothetical protein [Gammaproteobacteria bacterium]